MNRYKTGGPSKASAATLCQKCLKRGHYSYECIASKDDRPYVSRPSRSQQLLNPKLAPKLSAVLLEPRSASKTITSKAESARKETSRSRKRSIESDGRSESKRRRSISSHSSNSVATISTNRSKSRSRSRSPEHDKRRRHSVLPGRDGAHDEKVARRALDQFRRAEKSTRVRSRSPIRQYQPSQGRQSNRQRSHSPGESCQVLPSSMRNHRSPNGEVEHTIKPASTARERSPSPYSQRIALTQARNQT